MICAAFQSTYILDDSVRNAYFSYAWYLGDERAPKPEADPVLPLDSLGDMIASTDQNAGIDYFAYTADYKVLPRIPKRSKYGIVKQTPLIPNLVKNIQLRTSPKENVYTPPTVTKEEEILPNPLLADSSALAPLDSTAIVASVDALNADQPVDSLAVAAVPTEDKRKDWEQFRYGFNPLDQMQPDQEYYFRRYGWLLQNAAPKEESAQDPVVNNSDPLDSVSSDTTTAQKGPKGLFKKNPKREKKKKDEPLNETPVPDEGTKPDEGENDSSNNGNNQNCGRFVVSCVANWGMGKTSRIFLETGGRRKGSIL